MKASGRTIVERRSPGTTGRLEADTVEFVAKGLGQLGGIERVLKIAGSKIGKLVVVKCQCFTRVQLDDNIVADLRHMRRKALKTGETVTAELNDVSAYSTSFEIGDGVRTSANTNNESITTGATGQDVIASCSVKLLMSSAARNYIGERIANSIGIVARQLQVFEIGAQYVVFGGDNEIIAAPRLLLDGVKRRIGIVSVIPAAPNQSHCAIDTAQRVGEPSTDQGLPRICRPLLNAGVTCCHDLFPFSQMVTSSSFEKMNHDISNLNVITKYQTCPNIPVIENFITKRFKFSLIQ